MAATILFATGFECGRAGVTMETQSLPTCFVWWDDVVSGGRTGNYCARLTTSGGVSVLVSGNSYSFAYRKNEGVTMRITLYSPDGPPPSSSLELRFTSSTVTLYINDVAVKSEDFVCNYDYVPVQVYATANYTGVKINHVLVIEHDAGINDGYLHSVSFGAPTGYAYLDDLAVGSGGFLGQLRVEPVPYSATAPESYAVSEFGTSTDPLGDFNTDTGYKLRYHVNVSINSALTLAEHFAPGGPIYMAFNGAPPQYGIFVVNEGGYDTYDGALVAATGGNGIERGMAFTIINNAPSNPAIVYSPKHVTLSASVYPAQSALTVGYTFSVTGNVLDEGVVERALKIKSGTTSDAVITGYGDTIETRCAFVRSNLNSGQLSLSILELA